MARPFAVSITLSDADRAVLVDSTRRLATQLGMSQSAVSLIWHTADEILESVVRHCQRATNSHH